MIALNNEPAQALPRGVFKRSYANRQSNKHNYDYVKGH